ncbi:DUF4340 domain-containing protein [Pseudobutyrivibrio xylanivorans]|uniref:DUF4340 domain-containing protein n=1 Tax=Pseudobutyrivibrio xylanivorans TaxID=185007 RepID=A0A5P6VW18_PSEXY|nr:DUF4340 domain-containing protein [Pseudobutyrivibrio xylanivorans]QFJ55791.1 DUF4340 domain-containing protein [Pseudobutyrivibrio xylanivorans]
MKRAKTLLILSGILVVSVIAILAERAFKMHVDAINTIDEEVFSISQEDITSLSVKKDADSITIENSDGKWKYTDDKDFPVNQDYVSDMLANFQSVHASFIIDNVEDYSQYGLSNPEATITFTTADGDKVITFGTFSTIDEKRYICVDGGSVYLIDEDLLEKISGNVEDYLDRNKVYDFSQIKKLYATGDVSANIEYDPDGKYLYTDTYDYYSVDGDVHEAISSSKVESYLSTLKNLDLTKYETYKATDSDLKKYGLDNPNITIKLTGEVPVSGDDKDKAVESKSQTIYFSHKSDADEAYLYFKGSTIVYTITADEYESVAKANYKDLRPDEIVSFDWTKVAQLIVGFDGNNYVVDVEKSKKDGNTYTLDGETVDFQTVSSKLDTISLTEVGDSYEKGEKELSLSVVLDDDNTTKVSLNFYRYDGDSCVVEMDGKVIGLCSRSSMSSLREEMTSAILNKGKEESTEE